MGFLNGGQSPHWCRTDLIRDKFGSNLCVRIAGIKLLRSNGVHSELRKTATVDADWYTEPEVTRISVQIRRGPHNFECKSGPKQLVGFYSNEARLTCGILHYLGKRNMRCRHAISWMTFVAVCPMEPDSGYPVLGTILGNENRHL